MKPWQMVLLLLVGASVIGGAFYLGVSSRKPNTPEEMLALEPALLTSQLKSMKVADLEALEVKWIDYQPHGASNVRRWVAIYREIRAIIQGKGGNSNPEPNRRHSSHEGTVTL